MTAATCVLMQQPHRSPPTSRRLGSSGHRSSQKDVLHPCLPELHTGGGVCGLWKRRSHSVELTVHAVAVLQRHSTPILASGSWCRPFRRLLRPCQCLPGSSSSSPIAKLAVSHDLSIKGLCRTCWLATTWLGRTCLRLRCSICCSGSSRGLRLQACRGPHHHSSRLASHCWAGTPQLSELSRGCLRLRCGICCRGSSRGLLVQTCRGLHRHGSRLASHCWAGTPQLSWACLLPRCTDWCMHSSNFGGDSVLRQPLLSCTCLLLRRSTCCIDSCGRVLARPRRCRRAAGSAQAELAARQGFPTHELGRVAPADQHRDAQATLCHVMDRPQSARLVCRLVHGSRADTHSGGAAAFASLASRQGPCAAGLGRPLAASSTAGARQSSPAGMAGLGSTPGLPHLRSSSRCRSRLCSRPICQASFCGNTPRLRSSPGARAGASGTGAADWPHPLVCWFPKLGNRLAQSLGMSVSPCNMWFPACGTWLPACCTSGRRGQDSSP